MQIDGRFYMRPAEITIWEVAPIARCAGGNGKYKKHPYVQFVYRGIHFAFQSKHLMWMLLDAAHPKDPLPRTPIKNDIFFRNDMSIDSACNILNDLVNEGDGAFIEVVVGERLKDREHSPFEVVAILPNNLGSPDTTLRGVADMGQREGWSCISGILPYRDKHGLHERDGVVFDQHPLRVICYDLGRSICLMGYFMVFDEEGNDTDYRPKQAVVIKKTEDFFFDIVKNTISTFYDTLSQGYQQYLQLENPPRIIDKNKLERTHERDMRAHERWLRL